MTYLDGTERHVEADKPRPKLCPQCGGELVTRWVPNIVHRRRGDPPYHGVAYPLFVCLACKLSVKTASLPGKTLHTTREAARADGNKQVRETFRQIRKAQIPGKR